MKGQYTQKEISVNAYQLTRDVENHHPEWVEGLILDGRVSIERAEKDELRIYGCAVRTPEGKMRAKVGDYIVQEPDGSLRVLKASHFQNLYRLEGDAK